MNNEDNFKAWLLEQRDRDDPIGDLANDLARSGYLPDPDMVPIAVADALREAREEFDK